MNAKSIYDKLVNVEGVPSSILTYSDKDDCIIIEVQDYDKSVFKFAQKFFNGYKSVDIDYTNENKTIVWYNEVSEYSDRETIDSITRFYYDMKVKGLVESKKSARKSIKESVEFSKEKDIYIAQIKDSSISFAYTPIDTDDDFNGYFVFDGDDVIEYLNWKGADTDDMLKAFDDFEKAVKKYTSKGDAKIIIKDFHDKLGI